MPVADRSAPMLLVKLQTSDGTFRVVSDDVLTFKYIDSERKADKLTITVDNNDLSNFDDPVWRKGGKLIVQWGYPGALTPSRNVVIVSVKGFRVLTIEAHAESVLLNAETKCRVFENKTISQIVRDIATEHGFGRNQQHIDDTERVKEIVTQASLTDAQFIRRWASRLGFEFYVDFDGFHFHERRLGEAPLREIRYFTDQKGGDILAEPRIDNDLTARPGRVRVQGRDPRERQDIDVVADNESDSERRTLTELIEVVDPEDGGITQAHIVASSDENQGDADDRARARYRRVQQVAIKMTLPIIGDPLILAKTIIKIVGMGIRLSVRYYVEEVIHFLDRSGYKCDLKLVSDGHGGHSTTSTSARGLGTRTGLRGVGGGRRVADDLLQVLVLMRDFAVRQGDLASAGMIDRSATAVETSGLGAQSRRVVIENMRQIYNNQNANPVLRQRAADVTRGLAQQGNDQAATGRPNRRDAAPDDGGLHPVEIVDQETGDTITVYRPTPGRGTQEPSS